MAKNYVEDGQQITLIAPAGGVESGKPYAIGSLVVVALIDAAEGEPFSAAPGGVWELPVASGLAVGSAVGLLDGAVVAAATENAVPCGALLTAESGGTANVLLK